MRVEIKMLKALKIFQNNRGIALLITISVTTILVAAALEYNRRARFAVISTAAVRDRLTMANMAIEAGGKCGIFATDAVTGEYLNGRTTRPWSPVAADADADYCEIKQYCCEDIEPQVSFPHSPDRTSGCESPTPRSMPSPVPGSTSTRSTPWRHSAARR